jgi:hypothetical protein
VKNKKILIFFYSEVPPILDFLEIKVCKLSEEQKKYNILKCKPLTF